MLGAYPESDGLIEDMTAQTVAKRQGMTSLCPAGGKQTAAWIAYAVFVRTWIASPVWESAVEAVKGSVVEDRLVAQSSEPHLLLSLHLARSGRLAAARSRTLDVL